MDKTKNNSNRSKEGKFLCKYNPIFDQKLIEHMSLGFSFESFAGVVGVTRQSLYNWEKKFKSFKKAKGIGVSKSLMFWEALGIDGTHKGKGFNAASWIFNMKNRFGWSNKEEIKVTEDKNLLTHDKIMEYLEKEKM